MRAKAASEATRSPAVTELRQRLREFLAMNNDRPRGLRGAGRIAWQKDWTARLADAGLAGPSWPAEVGGMGLGLAGQVAYHQELTRAKAPGHPSPIAFIVAPTIIRHGTEAQRERFLRPILRADELWCQGFSEPGAGSDLPSLSTRAVRDGSDNDAVYRVTGQKVWTTGADTADWMFALVRTGEPDSHSAGISYLLLAMDSPGITVRPLRDITGRTHFSEVFFDDVVVPVRQRVGQENQGWEIARTSLGHERTTMSLAADLRYRRIASELFELARSTCAIGEPHIRQALARAEAGVQILTARAETNLAEALAGRDPGASASVDRLFRAEFERELHELALAVTGPDAMLDARAPQAPERGRWTIGYLATRASTIGAGTAEIQRNTIAESVLHLPKAPKGP